MIMLLTCTVIEQVLAVLPSKTLGLRDSECDSFSCTVCTSPVGCLSSFLCGKDWIMSANLATSCHYSSSKKSPLSPRFHIIPWTDHVFGYDEAPLKRATQSMKAIQSMEWKCKAGYGLKISIFSVIIKVSQE